jgi:hypothetical protein
MIEMRRSRALQYLGRTYVLLPRDAGSIVFFLSIMSLVHCLTRGLAGHLVAAVRAVRRI